MLLQQYAPTSVGMCDEQFNVLLGTVASVKVCFVIHVIHVETLLTEHDNEIINVSVAAYIILHKPRGAAVVIIGINLKYHSFHFNNLLLI